jgi:5,10-methylene-tetrahydrofolate dehydrogenase/methenyl tetrahydrofolate cyclohydrolase
MRTQRYAHTSGTLHTKMMILERAKVASKALEKAQSVLIDFGLNTTDVENHRIDIDTQRRKLIKEVGTDVFGGHGVHLGDLDAFIANIARLAK